jgi:hypothetical protein
VNGCWYNLPAVDTILHLIAYFSSQAKTIMQAPAVCAVIIGASAYLTWIVTKTYYKGQLESLRERIKLLEDRKKYETVDVPVPTPTVAPPPPSTTQLPEQPKVQITITEGVTSLALNDHTRLWVLLNVHVNGPTIEVTHWMLQLKGGDKDRPGFNLPFPRKLRYSPYPYPSDGELRVIEPLKEWLPGAGWLFFEVPGLTENDPLIDHIFGATFVLVAVERNGQRADSTKLPGPWLHRATEIFPLDD